MDPINSNVETIPQLFALKKAIQVQEQGILKLLENALPPITNTATGVDLTGLGKTLDIKV